MENKIPLPDMKGSIKRILRFIQLPSPLDALINYNTVYTKKDVIPHTLNTITQATRALHLTAHCRCCTCEHVSRRHHVNKFWAYTGGLTNLCPIVENVEPVIVNTGGPPLPHKRAPTQKSRKKLDG